MIQADVLIIGAGPSGAAAGALLHKRGYDCCIIERETFPRFSIGESLLPQCMDILDEAGFLPAVQAHGFQLKDGARFLRHGEYATFEFGDQFTDGWGYTYEVQRADFDKILADEAEAQGVTIHYQRTIESVEIGAEEVVLMARDRDDQVHEYRGRFVLDASGFGRVLPRLLDLEKPSTFPVRQSMFTHIEDNIDWPGYIRDKILVTIHPENPDVWSWLIPFSNGRASVGVVAEQAFIEDLPGEIDDKLPAVLNQDAELAGILANAKFDTPVNTIVGYATDVTSLHGPRFALLGNAGEFLDPIFSSGVTIALRSASLAAAAVDRTLQGEAVDWDADFSEPLGYGVKAFKAYVETWYEGSLHDVFFAPFQQPRIKQMVCSILAGYAWDTENAYTDRARNRIEVLARLSRAE